MGTPTKEQIISLIGTLLKALGAGLAARGVTVSPDIWSIFAGPEAIQFYAGAVLIVAPAVNDWFIHSIAGKLKAAGTVPGIEPIKVLPTAPPEVQAVAADPNIPMVIPVVRTPPIQRS